jgi:hypothetical protein
MKDEVRTYGYIFKSVKSPIIKTFPLSLSLARFKE